MMRHGTILMCSIGISFRMLTMDFLLSLVPHSKKDSSLCTE
jgi:hypothetical protein